MSDVWINHGMVQAWKRLDIPSQARLLGLTSTTSGTRLPLRIIGVQYKCIVLGNEWTRYAALSYFWGKVDQLKLLMSNLPQLITPGAFSCDKLDRRLPHKISDAIELTPALGEHCSWFGMSHKAYVAMPGLTRPWKMLFVWSNMNKTLLLRSRAWTESMTRQHIR